MRTRALSRLMILALVAAAAACSRLPLPGILGGRGPSLATLSDTTLCVLDASSARGLTTVEAKRDPEDGRLYLPRGSRAVPLEKVYPEGRGSGYAQDEGWFRDATPIQYRNRRFVKYGGERVIPARALVRGATHQGVRFFLDPRDAPPTSVLYVPLRPGCIFQPYLNEREAPRGR